MNLKGEYHNILNGIHKLWKIHKNKNFKDVIFYKNFI